MMIWMVCSIADSWRSLVEEMKRLFARKADGGEEWQDVAVDQRLSIFFVHRWDVFAEKDLIEAANGARFWDQFEGVEQQSVKENVVMIDIPFSEKHSF